MAVGRVIGVRADGAVPGFVRRRSLEVDTELFSKDSEPMQIDPTAVGRGTTIVEPVRVEQGVVLGDGCEIGPEVFLESGCDVGRGAVVRRSIVLRGGRVARGETVEDRVVT